MDYKEAERHFQDLQDRHDRGELDDNEFRVQVAKLMFQDEQGAFWMVDADDGTWFCNRGDGWVPCDPRAEGAAAATPASARGQRRWQRPALAMATIVLLGLVGFLVLSRWSPTPLDRPQPTPTPIIEVQVSIASPADGSQVTLDQEVAVESTIQNEAGLQIVDRVELQVNGVVVDSRSVQPQLQAGQTSLPLSQSWVPTATGEHQVSVTALSEQGRSLGAATVALEVAEISEEALPEPACTPDGRFVADVTIPPGTAIRPGAQMDKVWQVANSGTCAWGTGYELTRVGGTDLGAPESVAVPRTAAGESADLTMAFQAPSAAGTYSTSWQMRTQDGTLFGPILTLSFEVEVQAEESLPPEAPTDLQATVTENGKAIRLVWQDESNNEDAFRVYREDVEASIGLAPADAQHFVDNTVACGHTYRYSVVAFNASGASPFSEFAEATMAACAPGEAPTLVFTVVPTQIVATEPITIVFEATDDLGVAQVTIMGEETGDATLDAGRTFACEDAVCAGIWPVTPTIEVSTTLTLVAVARDLSGQESEQARTTVTVRPQE